MPEFVSGGHLPDLLSPAIFPKQPPSRYRKQEPASTVGRSPRCQKRGTPNSSDNGAYPKQREGDYGPLAELCGPTQESGGLLALLPWLEGSAPPACPSVRLASPRLRRTIAETFVDPDHPATSRI